jgi:DNA-binding CsgD family transcriptional regulator
MPPVYRGPFGKPQAERLLWRAGFGPRPGEAERLAKVGFVAGERTNALDRSAGMLIGADDYLTKPVDAGELIARVRRLVERNGSNRPTAATNGKLAGLTKRELEVLNLLAEGYQQDEIALRLVISPKTVATHIQRILTKLDVRSRAQAVALALRKEDGDVVGHVAAAAALAPA